MAKLVNLIGRKIGKLTVCGLVLFEKGVRPSRTKWWCVCDCGKEVNVFGVNLTRKHSTSCGCSRKDSLQQKYPRLYRRWTQIKQRCFNQNTPLLSSVWW